MHSHSTHHHIHKRKRIHQKNQSFPHHNKYVRVLDTGCLFFSVLMPATTIPQIWTIYVYQEVAGLSLLMWVLYTIGVIPFLLYGLVHKEKPLIVLNILWLIAQVTIITGILLYR